MKKTKQRQLAGKTTAYKEKSDYCMAAAFSYTCWCRVNEAKQDSDFHIYKQIFKGFLVCFIPL